MARLGTNIGTGHRCRTDALGWDEIMSKDKDARPEGSRPGAPRLKTLRRELLDLETDLERARRRRDKAQARLEALEAIAEQLASAIASAAAAEDARQARRDAADAAAVAASQPSTTVPSAEGSRARRSREVSRCQQVAKSRPIGPAKLLRRQGRPAPRPAAAKGRRRRRHRRTAEGRRRPKPTRQADSRRRPGRQP